MKEIFFKKNEDLYKEVLGHGYVLPRTATSSPTCNHKLFALESFTPAVLVFTSSLNFVCVVSSVCKVR